MGRGGGDLSQDYTEPLISFQLPIWLAAGGLFIYGQIIGQKTIWKFSRMNRKRNEKEKLAIIAILGQ